MLFPKGINPFSYSLEAPNFDTVDIEERMWLAPDMPDNLTGCLSSFFRSPKIHFNFKDVKELRSEDLAVKISLDTLVAQVSGEETTHEIFDFINNTETKAFIKKHLLSSLENKPELSEELAILFLHHIHPSGLSHIIRAWFSMQCERFGYKATMYRNDNTDSDALLNDNNFLNIQLRNNALLIESVLTVRKIETIEMHEEPLNQALGSLEAAKDENLINIIGNFLIELKDINKPNAQEYTITCEKLFINIPVQQLKANEIEKIKIYNFLKQCEINLATLTLKAHAQDTTLHGYAKQYSAHELQGYFIKATKMNPELAIDEKTQKILELLTSLSKFKARYFGGFSYFITNILKALTPHIISCISNINNNTPYSDAHLSNTLKKVKKNYIQERLSKEEPTQLNFFSWRHTLFGSSINRSQILDWLTRKAEKLNPTIDALPTEKNQTTKENVKMKI